MSAQRSSPRARSAQPRTPYAAHLRSPRAKRPSPARPGSRHDTACEDCGPDRPARPRRSTCSLAALAASAAIATPAPSNPAPLETRKQPSPASQHPAVARADELAKRNLVRSRPAPRPSLESQRRSYPLRCCAIWMLARRRGSAASSSKTDVGCLPRCSLLALRALECWRLLSTLYASSMHSSRFRARIDRHRSAQRLLVRSEPADARTIAHVMADAHERILSWPRKAAFSAGVLQSLSWADRASNALEATVPEFAWVRGQRERKETSTDWTSRCACKIVSSFRSFLSSADKGNAGRT